MQEIDPREFRLQAMNLLSRREHLRQELQVKLLKRFGREAQPAIESVLDELEQDKLLSDERYVTSYVNSRSNRGYGPERIRQELRQRGVQAQLLETALAEAEVDWVLLAHRVRVKKFGVSSPSDFRERSRQLRFLLYRGFGNEFASAALDEPESLLEDAESF